jgi:CHAT domain-containing protein/tetratricopeptide (TPR) repeat protein
MFRYRRVAPLLLSVLLFLDTGTFAAPVPGATPAPEQQKQLQERDRLAQQVEELRGQGKYEDALAAATKALALTREVRGAEHAEVAQAQARLAESHELAGDFASAVKHRQQVLALRQKLDGEKHWRTADARLALAFVEKVTGLAEADRSKVMTTIRKEQEAARLDAQGKYADAERLALEVLETYRAVLGPETADVARVWHLVGRTRLRRNDSKGGKEANEHAVAIRRKVLPARHPDLARSLVNLGNALSDLKQARACYEEAIGILRASLGPDDPLIALGLNNLGLVQYALREYAAAKQSHEEALAIYRKALPKDHPDIAMSLDSLGIVQYALREYAAAKESHEEALAVRHKALPKDHPKIADSLENLGNVQHDLREYAAARKSYEEALTIRHKALPKDHPDIATSLSNLGNVQFALREYAAARKSYEEALTIRHKALPKDHTDIATSLNNLGTLQADLQEYAAAKQCLEEALAIYRKALPKGHPNIATSLNNLGNVQRNLREYAAAKQSLEEALTIRHKALPKDHPNIADSLNNLGIVQADLREYVAARKSFEEALAIRHKALPKDHPNIADSLDNLGNVQHDLREYAAARQSHEEALAIKRKALPKDDPGIATTLDNLGIVQHDLREYVAARKSYEEALTIRHKALPKDHPDIATSLSNLGTLQHDLREYAAAKQSQEEALAIRRKALPKDHPDIATSLSNLGNVQRNLREYAAARQSHEEALAIRRKALPKDDPNIADSLSNLGNVQGHLREYAAARQSHEEALAIRRKALPKDHTDIARSLSTIGLLSFCAGGDSRPTIAWLAEAIDIEQQHLARLALAQAESEQLRAAAETRVNLDLLLSAAERAGPGHTDLTYPCLLAIKGTVTARQRWARSARDLTDPVAADLLRQLRQANRDLLATAIDRADGPGPHPRNTGADLRELSERRARLERALAAQSATFREFLAQGRRRPADVRAALPSNGALIDCIDYDHVSHPARAGDEWPIERRMVAFVVRPEQKGVVVVPLGSSRALAELIERWRASYGAGKAPPAGAADPGAELRKRVWEPLAKHLAGVNMVLVSPDGPLQGLPWAALPGSKVGTFLIQEYAFAVVPVPQLLPDLLRDGPGQRADPISLVMGDIDFDALPGAETARDNHFPPLPGTKAEAAAVHELFRAAFADRPAQLLTSKEATKEAFVSRAPKCSHVLVASHGFFLPEPEQKESRATQPTRSPEALLFRRDVVVDNPALRSGLVFAGANRSALGQGDAFLTALEASELDLHRVDLAVLSACETGLGKVEGGEGVLGLQRAFQIAGAKTAVTSLWKVPDTATQALMTRFHRNLWEKKDGTPLGKLAALREAQLWLITEGRKHPELLRGLKFEEPKFAPSDVTPPHYWAAFVLSGDWR